MTTLTVTVRSAIEGDFAIGTPPHSRYTTEVIEE